MTKYIVDYYASYSVEADNEDEAIRLAIEQHEDLPDGSWTVIGKDEE